MSSPERTKRILRLMLAVLGVLTLVAGVVAVFTLRSAAVAVAAVIAGAALLVVALFVDRLVELAIGTNGVSLRLSVDAVNAGAPTAATELENSGLAEFAAAYALVNSELHGNQAFYPARVHFQDALVERARMLGLSRNIPKDEVRALYVNGSPVLKTVSLGLMKGNATTADFDVVSTAITRPSTQNEQYQALRLAEQLWSQWTRQEREKLGEQVGLLYFEPGSDRSQLAQHILSLPTAPQSGPAQPQG